MRNLPPDRVYHYLRHNHGNHVPRMHVCVDTEAYRDQKAGAHPHEIQRLLLGHAVCFRVDQAADQVDDELEFTDHRDFWDWLVGKWQKGTSITLWAHNLGYDLTLLDFWQLVQSGFWRFFSFEDVQRVRAGETADPPKGYRGLMVLEDPPTILCCRHGRIALNCVDLVNYWQLPLAELAKWVGMRKAAMPAGEDCLDDWRRYCRQDARILAAVVKKLLHWWQSIDGGHFAWTAPGLAWQCFRHRFMAHQILVDASEEAQELGRAALVGGEVRSFFVGRFGSEPKAPPGSLWHQGCDPPDFHRGPVHVLDVQSCYAGVMERELFPMKLLGVYLSPEPATLKSWQRNRCIVAEVTIDSDKETFPVLINGERYFALGCFDTVLCGPELARALELGAVRRCRRCAVYKGGRIFRDYVRFFWSMRREAQTQGDTTTDKLAKLMLNSLAGKFGERAAGWTTTRDFVPAVMWGGVYRHQDGEVLPDRYRAIAGYLQKEGAKTETRESMPLITAFVTSYARDQLRRLRLVAGPNSVLYQDTDSLHVTADGLHRLGLAGHIAAGELGRLKLEYTASDGEYRGWKDYTHDGHLVVAGLSMKARQLDHGLYEQPEFERLTSILSRKPDGSVKVGQRRLQLGSIHPRAEKGQYGWTNPVRVKAGAILAPGEWSWLPPDRGRKRERQG